MRNLKELVSEVVESNKKSTRNSFNTNDWLLSNLLDKKVKRSEVIKMITFDRLNLVQDLDKKTDQEIKKLILKLSVTSKNGLDTSVSDSNNNSSFSYNDRFKDYKLLKIGSGDGQILSIVRTKNEK